MIQNTLAELEGRLRAAESLRPEAKRELLNLIAELRTEVDGLSRTPSEQAESITRFTSLSTHEATRGERNPELMKHSIGGLAASISGFEKSHPKLVEAVNRICTTLSNLGI